MLVIHVANLIGYAAVKWLIGLELSLNDVGGYTLIATLVGMAGALTRAIANIVMPISSEYEALQETQRAARLLIQATKYSFIVSSGLCLIPLPILKPLFAMWVGGSYSPADLDVIVASARHPLARERRIPLARVIREPFVVREKGSDTWQSMVDGFGRHLAQLNIAMEIKSTETIKQAVVAGMGVSFLSAHTVSRELRAGSLAMLDVVGFPLMLNWYVVHRRNKRLPPVAQAFKDFLLRDGARLIEEIVPVRQRRSPRASG